MVKQITEDIYSIGVPLSGNPLKELNSYWIRGTQRDLLIDTADQIYVNAVIQIIQVVG